jgi:hypothetical protein
MEKEAQAVQRLYLGTAADPAVIEDTFASGQFTRFDPAASEIRSTKSIASKPPDNNKWRARNSRPLPKKEKGNKKPLGIFF